MHALKFERFDAVFSGAGDTLSAALAALVAGGADLAAASVEALAYLDRCLDGGFRPGMGNVVPDRLFWAQPEPGDKRSFRSVICPPGSTMKARRLLPALSARRSVAPGVADGSPRASRRRCRVGRSQTASGCRA